MPTVGIVTGAGRGMGFACAERLLASVDNLFVVDVDPTSLDSMMGALSDRDTKVVPVVADITDASAMTGLADRVRSSGTLRSVAHAAGVSPTMADWRRIFSVDLVGTATLVDALRPLATQRTAMVCFASMAANLAGADPNPLADAVIDAPLEPDFLDRLHEVLGTSIEDSGLAYMWAKRGVQRLARREALRWGEVAARINSVSPGMIDTPMGQQEFDNQPFMAELLKVTPLRRTGRAEELAAVVAFLLSDDASFITGTDVLVDGGVCAAVSSSPLL